MNPLDGNEHLGDRDLYRILVVRGRELPAVRCLVHEVLGLFDAGGEDAGCRHLSPSLELVALVAVQLQQDGLVDVQHDACFPVHPAQLQVPNHGTQTMGGATGLQGPLAELVRNAPQHNVLEVLFLQAEGDEFAPEARRNWREDEHTTIYQTSLLDPEDTTS